MQMMKVNAHPKSLKNEGITHKFMIPKNSE